jgi:hypothetical protein
MAKTAKKKPAGAKTPAKRKTPAKWKAAKESRAPLVSVVGDVDLKDHISRHCGSPLHHQRSAS